MKKQAFTLVELIVVITILAILGTIGFINLQGFSSSSRDSKRISELTEIRSGLQIYQARNGILPTPSEQSVTIGSGSTNLIIQGYVGESVLNEIRMNGDSKDPSEKQYYTYSVNANKTKFQLLGLLENNSNLTSFNTLNIVPKTHASYENRHPYIVGNIVGIFLDETTNTPIQELVTSIDLNTDTNNYKVVFLDETLTSSGTVLYTDIINKTNNIGTKNCILDEININHSESKTFYSENTILWDATYSCIDRQEEVSCNNGILSSNSSTYQYSSCAKGIPDNCIANENYVFNTHTYSIPELEHNANIIEGILSDEVIENNGVFKYTLNDISCNDGLHINPVENVAKTLISCDTGFTQYGNECKRYITSYDGGKRWSDTTYAISCNGYKNPNGEYAYVGSTGDGIYWIKPDSNSAFKVYCDMTTDGGGWTLLSNSFVNNGGSTIKPFDVTWNTITTTGVGDITSLSNNFHISMNKYLALANINKQVEYSWYAKSGLSTDPWQKTITYNNHYLSSDGYYTWNGVGVYSLSAFTAYPNSKLTTNDQDNDTHTGNCAQSYNSFGWYTACHGAHFWSTTPDRSTECSPENPIAGEQHNRGGTAVCQGYSNWGPDAAGHYNTWYQLKVMIR